MKIQNRTKSKQGFTLIEMIGVLAIIAILASLLIPKVFQAINDSRVNNTATAVNTMKAAAAEHYGKWGKFCMNTTGTGLTNTVEIWDQSVLFAEQRVDKPLIVKIGDGVVGTAAGAGTRVRAVDISALTATSAPNTTDAYNLDGAGSANDVTGAWMVEAVISGVAAQDAVDLNNRIDGTGTTLGTATLGSLTEADTKGRVRYAAPSGGVTEVHVYLTHR
jgi:prepilin-type N-terminal cleavage/methylation domain-containing protein